jgi:hypothetical protein
MHANKHTCSSLCGRQGLLTQGRARPAGLMKQLLAGAAASQRGQGVGGGRHHLAVCVVQRHAGHRHHLHPRHHVLPHVPPVHLKGRQAEVRPALMS